MAYEVQTPVFDGPFDLLLHLILREELDLYEVSLCTIVDAYLAELDRLRQAATTLDLDVATEFLLIAATLIELKARRLLPVPESVEVDDELGLWEERDLLLGRLLECKTFKDAAAELSAMEAVATRSVPRRSGPGEHFLALAPDLLAGVTPADLRAACLRACRPRSEPRVSTEHLGAVKASVHDTVAELSRSLPRLGRTTFRRLTAGLSERLELVVHFLAILELCKLGLVELDQVRRFGDITVSWSGAPDRLADRGDPVVLGG
ncbi:MAG TPA: ScpA family protein [Acidimicrobiales bacterium]|jgi:segregation and condensation protein A|nr:ScpA family protein [Acidimicrobiales bacterium]